MILIKYFFISLIIIGTFLAGSLGIIEDSFIKQAEYALLFVACFLILNFIAKIAWRILFLVLGVFFLIYFMNYFGIIEFSLPGLNNAKQEIIDEIDIKKGFAEK